MKDRILIIAGILVITVALIGLNAASYVQKEKVPDSEMNPNRSSYAVGPTGSRAFFDLIASTHKTVSRWQVPVEDLNKPGNQADTFVIVGPVKREITDRESEEILNFVAYGGRLVLIDRDPKKSFLTTDGAWKVKVDATIGDANELLKQTVDPSNSTQMTSEMAAVKPVSPTRINTGVTAVQPSKFRTLISLEYAPDESELPSDGVVETEATDQDNINEGIPLEENVAPGKEESVDESLKGEDEEIEDAEPTPTQEGLSDDIGSGSGEGIGNRFFQNEGSTPTIMRRTEVLLETDESAVESEVAPLVHLGEKKGGLVVGYPYGAGEIIVITDPYVVSNAGIRLVDNSVMALNAVSYGNVVFDEYHQGYGNNRSALIGYFRGTPVIPVFLQLLFVIALLMYARSRRFARPLPMEKQSRISKLEYVSAMAQLKQRTKAHDLAIENIMIEFRRRACGLLGLNATTVKPEDLALAISERTGLDKSGVFNTLSQCEDVMHGASVRDPVVLRLARELREIEKELGLTRRNVSTASRK